MYGTSVCSTYTNYLVIRETLRIRGNPYCIQPNSRVWQVSWPPCAGPGLSGGLGVLFRPPEVPRCHLRLAVDARRVCRFGLSECNHTAAAVGIGDGPHAPRWAAAWAAGFHRHLVASGKPPPVPGKCRAAPQMAETIAGFGLSAIRTSVFEGRTLPRPGIFRYSSPHVEGRAPKSWPK